jgi:hypothetical protein
VASDDILDDALISVYLNQPIVWYAHHDDLADGYEVLAELAGWLCGLGRTEWLPLARVSRTNARISEPVSVRDLDSLELVAPGPSTVAADGPRRTPQSRRLASGG